jgi:hypothetical protein
MEIISKQEAKQKGLKFYFTGIACKNGHIENRYVCDSSCTKCVIDRSTLWAKENPESKAASVSKWQKNNKEKVNSKNAKFRINHPDYILKRNREWANKNPEKKIRSSRKSAGLPEPTRPCPTVCERCKKPEAVKSKNGTPRVLCLDHDHETGEFRGWLCQACNTGIGKLGDTSKDLFQAAYYLLDSEPEIFACY